LQSAARGRSRRTAFTRTERQPTCHCFNTSNWNTTSTGTEAASSAISGNTVWLRATMDVRPSSTKQGKFSYSTDGITFTSIGAAYTLNSDWQFYPGYRYGIFNFATSALGGAVTVKSFQLTSP
jgi:hypothetical protein